MITHGAVVAAVLAAVLGSPAHAMRAAPPGVRVTTVATGLDSPRGLASGRGDGVATVATGLDSPRGLAFGPGGQLYVAEAGRGGRGPCRPGHRGRLVCFGHTGAISVIADGGRRRALRHLPSLALPSGAEATGPSDVSVGADGQLYYTVSGAGLHRAGDGALGAYDPGNAPEGDLIAVLASGRGLLVVDRATGSLRRIGARGRGQSVAAFDRPTSVARGPDGALYVGDRSRVWRVEPGRAPRVHASGFTGVVDLAWSADGVLYILEATGGLIRNGQRRTVVADRLTAPGGLAIRGRHAYVTVCGVCRDAGAVIRLPLRPGGQAEPPLRPGGQAEP